MSPIPGVVSSVIAVEHIVACILQELGSFFGFFHIAANFYEIIFTRHSTLAKALGLGNNRVAQRHREILAANLFNFFDYLCSQAVSVLKRAAIFVGPLVGILHRELIQQIALVHSMHFDAINSGFLQLKGSFAVGIDDLFDLPQT